MSEITFVRLNLTKVIFIQFIVYPAKSVALRIAAALQERSCYIEFAVSAKACGMDLAEKEMLRRIHVLVLMS